jgi:glutamine amidotransferase
MIAILKYNAGNIRSVQDAVTRAGYRSVITDNESELLMADKVIIPGVGEAGSAMRYLREKELDKLISTLKQPVLGICLGLQLMCNYSEEADTECMGIFDSTVRKFPTDKIVPHMGWNNFTSLKGEIFRGISPEEDMYYVHSYYAEISLSTVATCQYILPFSAALNRDNFYGTQFHPEKSAKTGATFLKNFLEL